MNSTTLGRRHHHCRRLADPCGDGSGDDNVGEGNAAVAGSGALLNLMTDASAALASGRTVINSAIVTTLAAQTYNDAVIVGTSGAGEKKIAPPQSLRSRKSASDDTVGLTVRESSLISLG